MVVAIGLRVKQYILLFAVLSFVYFMKRGFLLPRRNTKSSIATKHAPSSVEASARDPHFHDITCVFSLAASRIAILNHESAVLCLFKDQCRTAAQSYYKDYKEIIALRAAWDRTKQLAANLQWVFSNVPAQAMPPAVQQIIKLAKKNFYADQGTLAFQRGQKELHAAMEKLEELDKATGLVTMLHSTSRAALEAAQVLYGREHVTSVPRVQAVSLEEAHTMRPSM